MNYLVSFISGIRSTTVITRTIEIANSKIDV